VSHKKGVWKGGIAEGSIPSWRRLPAKPGGTTLKVQERTAAGGWGGQSAPSTKRFKGMWIGPQVEENALGVPGKKGRTPKLGVQAAGWPILVEAAKVGHQRGAKKTTMGNWFRGTTEAGRRVGEKGAKKGPQDRE